MVLKVQDPYIHRGSSVSIHGFWNKGTELGDAFPRLLSQLQLLFLVAPKERGTPLQLWNDDLIRGLERLEPTVV